MISEVAHSSTAFSRSGLKAGREPIRARRLVRRGLSFRLLAEVADLGEELVGPHPDAAARQPRGQLEERARRRLQSPGADEPRPVRRDLRVALPREELKRKRRRHLFTPAQEQCDRDLVVIEEIVSKLVPCDEAQLGCVECLEQARGQHEQEP